MESWAAAGEQHQAIQPRCACWRAAENSHADALKASLVLVLTRLQPTATRFSFPNHGLTSRKTQAVEIVAEDAKLPEWLALKSGHIISSIRLFSRC